MCSMARAYASTRMEGRTFKHLLFRHAEPLFYVFDILWYEHVKSDDDPEQSIFRNDKDLRYVSLIGGSGCLTQQRSGERMSASRGQPTFPVEPRQELPSLNLGPRSALFGGCKMLGDISIAEVRVFFILVWTNLVKWQQFNEQNISVLKAKAKTAKRLRCRESP